MAHPDARDRTLVALAVQRGVLPPAKLSRALALCERLGQPADLVLPRWIDSAADLVTQGRGYRYRCGCRLRKLDELASESELRCSACRRPFAAEVSPDPLEESSVRGRPVPLMLEETIREPARFAPSPAPEATMRDPYRGQRSTPLPERIGPFEIEHELGSGAMGAVYLAKHPLGRPVAVKVLHGSVDTEALLRFQREVHLGRQLRHPGIVEVLDTGQTDDGQHYLVMDYVPGQTLRAKLANGPLEPAEALQIVRQASEAVAFLHAQDLIHRDLKPENLILDPARGRVRITDLGLARPLKDLSITDTGKVVGTPHYMAPEQLAADRELDPSVDVYALGVILYECLTGATLYPELSALALAAAIFEEPPPVPQREGQSLPPALVTVCRKALDPDPRLRYADGAQLAYDLACISSLNDAPKPRAWIWFALLGASACLALALTLVLWPATPSAPTPNPTSTVAEPAPSPSVDPELERDLKQAELDGLHLVEGGRVPGERVARWNALIAQRPRDSRPLLARAFHTWLAGGNPIAAHEDMVRAMALDPTPRQELAGKVITLSHTLGFERAAVDWVLRWPAAPTQKLLLAGLLIGASPPVQDLSRAEAIIRGLPQGRDEGARAYYLGIARVLQGRIDEETRLLLEPFAQLGDRQREIVASWLRRDVRPGVSMLSYELANLAAGPAEPLRSLVGARNGDLPPDALGRIAMAQPKPPRALLLIQASRMFQSRGQQGQEAAPELLELALDAALQTPNAPALVSLARRALARALVERGGLSRARQAESQLRLILDGDRSLFTDGELSDVWVLLAQAHLEQAQRAEAKHALEQAALHEPDDRREIDAVLERLDR